MNISSGEKIFDHLNILVFIFLEMNVITNCNSRASSNVPVVKKTPDIYLIA